MIIFRSIINNSVKPKDTALCTLEIEKKDVADEFENRQLNENIRVNKSILKRRNNHITIQYITSLFETIGLIIKGADIFTYIISPYQRIVTAVKTLSSGPATKLQVPSRECVI